MEERDYRGFTVSAARPGVALVTFDEPDRLNGMTMGLKRDLVEVLAQLQLDEATAVVVFTGTGRAFSAGDDIAGDYYQQPAVMPGYSKGRAGPMWTYAHLRTMSQELTRAVRRLDKLTVAALNGVTIQSGLSLALACDFRLAAREARLGSATLRFGYLPDEGGHYLLVQHLGVGRTMDFLMRKRIVSADEALALGLVSEVVDGPELVPAALALAAELAAGPQAAMRLLKRAVYTAAEATLEVALEDIATKAAIGDHHPDAHEGQRAFREKRPPEFNQ